jgi:cation-transporting ATPase 13A3/4/5
MGTKVVRVRATTPTGGATSATALVVRTGFNTSKGSLVRSMLFPKPNQFQFYRDSFRFIGVLAMIAAFGFLASSINFIRLGVDRTTMILRALDLITIVVPPALPATMQIGTSFAISRLRNNGIFCISPPRVNIGGKVDCMCFDKTGTLTEDGLDIHGVRAVQHDGSALRFSEEMKSSGEIDSDQSNENSTSSGLFHAMATCHSLKLVNDELVGDPLDHKMFEFINWELEESGGATSIGAKSVTESADNSGSKITKGIVPTVVRPKGAKKFEISFTDTEVWHEMTFW